MTAESCSCNDEMPKRTGGCSIGWAYTPARFMCFLGCGFGVGVKGLNSVTDQTLNDVMQ